MTEAIQIERIKPFRENITIFLLIYAKTAKWRNLLTSIDQLLLMFVIHCNILQGIIGASPDAIVVTKAKGCDKCSDIGLCEFKAPIHGMYTNDVGIHGIPRNYMAQIQGQMGVTGMDWCDFMAVCVKTREIMLKRIHFQPMYWKHVSSLLKAYSKVLKASFWCMYLGFACK